jgi:hypothetical protein
LLEEFSKIRCSWRWDLDSNSWPGTVKFGLLISCCSLVVLHWGENI